MASVHQKQPLAKVAVSAPVAGNVVSLLVAAEVLLIVVKLFFIKFVVASPICPVKENIVIIKLSAVFILLPFRPVLSYLAEPGNKK
jgi:hypothetical protein